MYDGRRGHRPHLSHSRWVAALIVALLAIAPAPGLAGHPGAAHDGEGCSGSPMHVGDTLPSDPSADLETVSDIYALWAGSMEIGWFYFAGDRRTIYLQYNYATIATYGARALGVRLDSVAAAGAFGNIVPWNHRPVARRYRVTPCWTSATNPAG